MRINYANDYRRKAGLVFYKQEGQSPQARNELDDVASALRGDDAGDLKAVAWLTTGGQLKVTLARRLDGLEALRRELKQVNFLHLAGSTYRLDLVCTCPDCVVGKLNKIERALERTT